MKRRVDRKSQLCLRRPSKDDVSDEGGDDDAGNGEKGEETSPEHFVDAADAADDLDVQLEHLHALGLQRKKHYKACFSAAPQEEESA